ncbi:hypothetical protein ACRAWF_05700 [Streptomyces sp. L7]
MPFDAGRKVDQAVFRRALKNLRVEVPADVRTGQGGAVLLLLAGHALVDRDARDRPAGHHDTERTRRLHKRLVHGAQEVLAHRRPTDRQEAGRHRTRRAQVHGPDATPALRPDRRTPSSCSSASSSPSAAPAPRRQPQPQPRPQARDPAEATARLRPVPPAPRTCPRPPAAGSAPAPARPEQPSSVRHFTRRATSNSTTSCTGRCGPNPTAPRPSPARTSRSPTPANPTPTSCTPSRPPPGITPAAARDPRTARATRRSPCTARYPPTLPAEYADIEFESTRATAAAGAVPRHVELPMARRRSQTLNDALADWTRELHDDVSLGYSVEVAVITFGGRGVGAWRGPNSSTRAPR